MQRDQRVEATLFGAQLSGINFDKYEDIPVEASGHDCPKGIESVWSFVYTNSPLYFFLPFLSFFYLLGTWVC